MRISDWSFRRVLFRSMLIEEDADYFSAFWSKPGYLGHDSPQLVEKDIIDSKAKVVRVLTARELQENPAFADPEIQAAAYPAMFIAMLNHTMDLPMAVELAGVRSEEHTSELQSLMRNSYAVF